MIVSAITSATFSDQFQCDNSIYRPDILDDFYYKGTVPVDMRSPMDHLMSFDIDFYIIFLQM